MRNKFSLCAFYPHLAHFGPPKCDVQMVKSNLETRKKLRELKFCIIRLYNIVIHTKSQIMSEKKDDRKNNKRKKYSRLYDIILICY